MALEQLRAQFCFQVLQAAVQRGRRQEQGFCRLADGAATGDFVDVAKDAQVLKRHERCWNSNGAHRL
jgi:hypothetical protein